MDKYEFWIIFMSILVLGAVAVSGISCYAWVNSPTTWRFEFGFDNESLVMMESTLELSDSDDKEMVRVDEYERYYKGRFDEIQK